MPHFAIIEHPPWMERIDFWSPRKIQERVVVARTKFIIWHKRPSLQQLYTCTVKCVELAEICILTERINWENMPVWHISIAGWISYWNYKLSCRESSSCSPELNVTKYVMLCNVQRYLAASIYIYLYRLDRDEIWNRDSEDVWAGRYLKGN